MAVLATGTQAPLSIQRVQTVVARSIGAVGSAVGLVIAIAFPSQANVSLHVPTAAAARDYPVLSRRSNWKSEHSVHANLMNQNTFKPLEKNTTRWDSVSAGDEMSQDDMSQSDIEPANPIESGGWARLTARLLSPTPATTFTVLASGTYLYGQQPAVDQLETAYFVFESVSNEIIGALYMPSSSFDCVTGRVVDQRIALNITDSYSQETYSYALALNESVAEVASQAGQVTPPLNIEGFYPLPVREQDRAVLAACQAI